VGADYRELDIAPTVDIEAESTGLAADLRRSPAEAGLRSALGNLKARIRAVRLRYFANRMHALLLGTENRTEHYHGYFTIGGDEESDLELLGNYLKAEVVQLARALAVPSAVIDRAPSVDLWSGQTDEGELGFTYREADHILHSTVGGTHLGTDSLLGCMTDVDTTRRVLRRVQDSAFKSARKPVFPRSSRGACTKIIPAVSGDIMLRGLASKRPGSNKGAIGVRHTTSGWQQSLLPEGSCIGGQGTDP
jgi:NAD+ synthetase